MEGLSRFIFLAGSPASISHVSSRQSSSSGFAAVSDDWGGVSSNDCLSWHISCDNRAEPKDRTVADCHSGHNENPVTNPYVIADRHGRGRLLSLLDHRSLEVVESMVPCMNYDVAPHHHIAADVQFARDAAVNAQSRSVAQRHMSATELGPRFDIHVTSGGQEQRRRDYQPDAPPQPAAWISGRRETPCNELVDQPS